MSTWPSPEEVNKAREQAERAIGSAVEQARTPLLAALGAGDLAAQAVLDALHKVRDQLNERTESHEWPTDLNELKEKWDPAELRKLVDTYTQSAMRLYGYLATRGEDALDRLREQPSMRNARDQMETAQERVEEAVDDVRGVADDVLGKVTRATRSFGEKTARATEEAADDVAETGEDTAHAAAATVQKTGSQAATAVRETTRETTSKARSTKGSTTKKNTGGSGKASEN